MSQMTKSEYIAELSNQLRDLSSSDFEDAIHYVEEYFDEAGIENEQKVIEELGPPHRLAATIRADATIKQNNYEEPKQQRQYPRPEKPKSDLRNLWIIVLGIFALPLALPLTIAVIALIFAIFMTIFALIIAGIACAFGLLVVSIPALVSAISLFASNGADGMVALGISLMMLGVGILVMVALVSIFRSFIPWVIKKITQLFNRLKGGRKYEKSL